MMTEYTSFGNALGVRSEFFALPSTFAFSIKLSGGSFVVDAVGRIKSPIFNGS